MDQLPSISIIISTLHSARALESCLASIYAQSYPRELLEVIIYDGVLSETAREITKRYPVNHLVKENPSEIGKDRKIQCLKFATHELVAFIDGDHFLIGEEWLRRMVTPFQGDPEIIMSEPLYFYWENSSPSIIRYCALMGMNNPLYYYTGNFNHWNIIAQNWTGMNIDSHYEGDWFWFEAGSKDLIPMLGSNSPIYRRQALEEILPSYFFDIPHQLMNKKPRRFAKVHCPIIYWYCSTFLGFIRKQKRRMSELVFTSSIQSQTKDKNYSYSGMMLFIISVCLVFPCLITSIRGFIKRPDLAWFLHWPLSAITLAIYGSQFLQSRVKPINLTKDS